MLYCSTGQLSEPASPVSPQDEIVTQTPTIIDHGHVVDESEPHNEQINNGRDDEKLDGNGITKDHGVQTNNDPNKGDSQTHEAQNYDENEINGRFKITSLKWNNKLNDPESDQYRKLAGTIEDSLLDMLNREGELSEILEFTTSVKNFK